MAGKTSVFVDNSAPAVDAGWLNIEQTEQQNEIESSGQTLSDVTLDQRAIAMASYAAQGGVFAVDSGVADAYVLTQVSPFKAPFALKNGLTIRFRAGNANTGASTVVAFGFTSKALKKADGSTALSAGDISTTQDTVIRYDGTNFRILTGTSAIQTFLQTPTSANLAAALTDEYGSAGLSLFGTAWVTFSPGFTGFSVNPTMTARYCVIGKTCFVVFYTTVGGTSNATTFTITGLPFTSANQVAKYYGTGFGIDNSAGTAMITSISPNTTVINLFKGAADQGATWTNSGDKYANFQINYEIA